MLVGGATLVDFRLEQQEQSLQVTLVWQGGNGFAPEDYQLELKLLNDVKQPLAGWQAYQTQARYPTRAWERGDIIEDVGWLPLTDLAAGSYEVQLRILGQDGPIIIDWQTLTPFTLRQMTGLSDRDVAWTLWRNGQPIHKAVTFNERETVQITFSRYQLPITSYQLRNFQGDLYPSASAGPNWANFIVEPDWPAGDYYLAEMSNASPVLRMAESRRNFQMPQITSPLAVDFEGQVKLLGYDLPTRRVEPGDGLPIVLYWQGFQWMGEDFVIFDRLLDNHQAVWGGYDRLPREDYSTLLWAPGEIVTDGFAVPVAPDTPNGVYHLDLGLYRRLDGEAESLFILNPETGASSGNTSVTIGPIKVGDPPSTVTVNEVEPQTKMDVILGEKIQLLGFDVTNAENVGSSAGELSITSPALELAIYWQALSTMATNYTVFAHIRNAVGETVSQRDGPPANGAYPTSLWETGEIIRDEMNVSLEPLEPGRYDIVVGMYDITTGMRLAVEGSADNTTLLQSFEILGEQ
jgi:hypothetical protein